MYCGSQLQKFDMKDEFFCNWLNNLETIQISKGHHYIDCNSEMSSSNSSGV